MTLFIKFAIGEELIKRVLLALFKHLLKQLEHDLRHEKLVVMTVMRVHLTAFPRDFGNTVIISAIQLVKLCQ